MRKSGILMPVASLPSKYGVGTLGLDAYKFVDMLADARVKIWQILPLNPLGYGNSPYQPLSSFAGDEIYIDLNLLAAEGLMTVAPVEYQGPEADRIDYEGARAHKEVYLRMAYRRFNGGKEYEEFLKNDWVRPYAVFVALKTQNGLKSWTEWPEEQRNWILDHKYDISHLEDEIGYRMFAQFMFYKQWMSLKAYANSKGIEIMGDIPFYVGLDSLDVWSSREDFLINGDGVPSFVAGVPPDYFNEDGQRWGNPIYNWERLRESGFRFWIERLRYSAILYDILRIDHFRAFDTYWKIPAWSETARVGEWIEAPGYQLFDEVYRQLPRIQIVAEDLGDLRPQVLELRDHYKLMGMNVAEFTVTEPEKIVKHQLIYTGTHDNQPVAGWYRDLPTRERFRISNQLLKYGAPKVPISKRLIRYIMHSKADIAIVPMMDILGYDDRARLNEPGTVGSPNWEWRLPDWAPFKRRIPALRELIMESRRG